MTRWMNRLRAWRLSRRARRHARVGRPELWAMKRKFQIDFLRSAGLQPHHTLLDLGCGTLRGGIPVIAYLQPGHYYGVERRAEVLAEGRRELEESNLTDRQPTLIVADRLGDLTLPVAFDFIWAFSVLIHMTDEALADGLQLVQRALKPTGAFYANVKIGEEEEGHWQGFPVVSRPLSFYREQAARFGLSVEDVGSLASLGHHSGIESQDRQRMLRFSLVRCGTETSG